MRYVIRPKKHLHGKSLKAFYRDLFEGSLLKAGLLNNPYHWADRPTIVVEVYNGITTKYVVKGNRP